MSYSENNSEYKNKGLTVIKYGNTCFYEFDIAMFITYI